MRVMQNAGKAYSQNPDPGTKLGSLTTVAVEELNLLLNRYRKILGNRKLLSRLRDGGESARRTFAAVQAELEARADASQPQEPTAADAVEALARRIGQMEWTTGARCGGRPEPLDSDDSDVELAADTAPPVATDQQRAGPRPGATSATGRMLPKSATSQRAPHFQTNRARSAPAASRSSGIVARWADSALAGSVGPATTTRLLGMDESLHLLSSHDRQLQAERMVHMSEPPPDREIDDADDSDEDHIAAAASDL